MLISLPSAESQTREQIIKEAPPMRPLFDATNTPVAAVKPVAIRTPPQSL